MTWVPPSLENVKAAKVVLKANRTTIVLPAWETRDLLENRAGPWSPPPQLHPVSSSEGIRNNGLEDMTLEFNFICTLFVPSISCLSHHLPMAQKNFKPSSEVAMKGDSHFHSSGRQREKGQGIKRSPKEVESLEPHQRQRFRVSLKRLGLGLSRRLFLVGHWWAIGTGAQGWLGWEDPFRSHQGRGEISSGPFSTSSSVSTLLF